MGNNSSVIRGEVNSHSQSMKCNKKNKYMLHEVVIHQPPSFQSPHPSITHYVNNTYIVTPSTASLSGNTARTSKLP